MTRTLRATLPKAPTRAVVRREDLDTIRAEVHTRDVAAALARGRAEGVRDTLAGAAKLLESAAAQLDAARARAEQTLPREVVELAVEIADQVLRVRLAEGAYDLERIVRSALAGGGSDRGKCVVHLNPRDLEQLSGVPFREDTTLLAHPELAPGTVHVETKRGLLVRDPQEALEQIRESLLEGLV